MGEIEIVHEEVLRKLLHQGCQAGRLYQSEQSNFVHYHPKVLEGAYPQAIPLYENALFILLLFRSKTLENSKEAKFLLDRVLFYQDKNPESESYGNFPVYMHDFPYARDFITAFLLFMPLSYIQRDFCFALGDVLKTRLQEAITLLESYCRRALKNNKVPVWAAALFEDVAVPEELSWAEAGKLFMVATFRENKHVKDAIRRCIEALWHEGAQAVLTCPYYLSFDGFSPTIEFLDFVAVLDSDSIPERLKHSHIKHLDIALLFPEEQKMQYADTAFVAGYHIEKKATWGVSYTSQDSLMPMYMVTPNHTLLAVTPFQGTCAATNSTFTISFVVEPSFSCDFMDEANVFEFFVNFSPDLTLTVQNKAATVFHADEKATLNMKTHTIECSYHVEGEGTIIGHYIRKNRPQQKMTKGEYRTFSFDAALALRAVDIAATTRVTITLSVADA